MLVHMEKRRVNEGGVVQEQPKAGAREARLIDYSAPSVKYPVPLVLSLKMERHVVRRLVLETKLKGQGDSESKGNIITGL